MQPHGEPAGSRPGHGGVPASSSCGLARCTSPARRPTRWVREERAPARACAEVSASGCVRLERAAARATRRRWDWLLELHARRTRAGGACVRRRAVCAEWLARPAPARACARPSCSSATHGHGAAAMTLAVGVFVAALAADRHRARRPDQGRAGRRRACVLLTQTIDQEHAIEAIDWNTLGLLAGMMLMVKLTETDGRLHLARDPRRSALARPPARGRRRAGR